MDKTQVVYISIVVISILVIALIVSYKRRKDASRQLQSTELICKIGDEYMRGKVVVMTEDLVQVRVYVDQDNFLGLDLTAEQVIQKLTEGEQNKTILDLRFSDEKIIKILGVTKERLGEIRNARLSR